MFWIWTVIVWRFKKNHCKFLHSRRFSHWKLSKSRGNYCDVQSLHLLINNPLTPHLIPVVDKHCQCATCLLWKQLFDVHCHQDGWQELGQKGMHAGAWVGFFFWCSHRKYSMTELIMSGSLKCRFLTFLCVCVWI